MSDPERFIPSVTPPPGSGPPRDYAVNPPIEWRQVGPRLIAGLLVLTLLVLGLAWHAIDHRHHVLAAGTVTTTAFELRIDHRASVRLPWGTLDLGSTEPRTTLPDDVARNDVGGDVRPPSGGRFVGVTWSRDDDSSGVSQIGFAPTRGYVTEVALVTGGHSYPLTPGAGKTSCAALDICIGPYDSNEAWVAVDGDAADLGISVTYDSVTQTADMSSGRVESGHADGLSTVRTEQPACGTPRWSAGFTGHHVSCELTVVRTPFVPALGWAPRGRSWFTASVQVRAPYSVTYASAGTSRTLDAADSTAQLNVSLQGGKLVADQPAGQVDGDLGSDLPDAPEPFAGSNVAFSVPAGSAGGPLTVRTTWGLDAERGTTTVATRQVTATWTVRA